MACSSRGVSNQPGPEVIKLFFMLNSAEHEILTAHKYSNSQNQWKVQVLIIRGSHLS